MGLNEDFISWAVLHGLFRCNENSPRHSLSSYHSAVGLIVASGGEHSSTEVRHGGSATKLRRGRSRASGRRSGPKAKRQNKCTRVR
jgi:hypothetical protein